jgi:hypothetical protein
MDTYERAQIEPDNRAESRLTLNRHSEPATVVLASAAALDYEQGMLPLVDSSIYAAESIFIQLDRVGASLLGEVWNDGIRFLECFQVVQWVDGVYRVGSILICTKEGNLKRMGRQLHCGMWAVPHLILAAVDLFVVLIGHTGEALYGGLEACRNVLEWIIMVSES